MKLLSIGTGVWMAGISVMAPVANADIYKYVDKYGHVHLSDRPLHKGYRIIVRTWKGWEYRNVPSAPGSRKRYASLIDKVASQFKLDRHLVHAVVRAESSYNPVAISRAGAVGLMQLMPATAKRYGVRDRRDPMQNLRGGVRYLRDLMLMFDDLTLALAAYNAGEGAVLKYGKKVPPYKETQQYVRRVLSFYRKNRAS